MGPVGINFDPMVENLNETVVVGAAKENDLAVWNLAVVGSSWFDQAAAGSAFVMAAIAKKAYIGADEPFTAQANVSENVEVKALPDAALPNAIKVFDRSLEARFAGRCKDRYDSKSKAKPDDTTEGSGRVT